MKADLLKMDALNALPQPLFVEIGTGWWPVYDIDVATGVFRIDVVGLLQAEQFGGVHSLKDADGVIHDPDDFYNEDEPTQDQASEGATP